MEPYRPALIAVLVCPCIAVALCVANRPAGLRVARSTLPVLVLLAWGLWEHSLDARWNIRLDLFLILPSVVLTGVMAVIAHWRVRADDTVHASE